MDILASDAPADIWQNNLQCNIIIFIETINEVYAQSQSRSIRKSFSPASKQRLSKSALQLIARSRAGVITGPSVLSPILLGFALDRWCCRILALDPVPRAARAVRGAQAL